MPFWCIFYFSLEDRNPRSGPITYISHYFSTVPAGEGEAEWNEIHETVDEKRELKADELRKRINKEHENAECADECEGAVEDARPVWNAPFSQLCRLDDCRDVSVKQLLRRFGHVIP